MNAMSIEKNKDVFFCNVKRLRKQLGQSLEELAEQSGVPLEILEQLERNHLPKEMMVSDAYHLAVAFHCKIFELFQ